MHNSTFLVTSMESMQKAIFNSFRLISVINHEKIEIFQLKNFCEHTDKKRANLLCLRIFGHAVKLVYRHRFQTKYPQCNM